MKIMLSLVFLFISLLVRSQDFIEWISSQSDGDTCKEYGLLYNWYVASDPNITSGGTWVVPDSLDWAELGDYIGVLKDNGISYTGGEKLRVVGTEYWDNSDYATNEFNFNALGGGYRFVDGGYYEQKSISYHQSTDISSTDTNQCVRAYITRNTDYEPNFDMLEVGNVGGIKIEGASIRLVRPATVPEQALDDGDYVDDYVGNDLRTYKAVKIGDQIWLAQNLAETLFRNGDVIPSHGLDNDSTFTDTEWSELTYAGTCAYNDSLSLVACGFSFPEFEYANAKYGYLYNWYVVSGDSLSSSSDWAVPTDAQYNTLITYLGGTSAAGHKLREANSVYWNTIINNTNESEFNARGGGYRNLSTGAFANIKASGIYHTKTASFGAYSYVLQLPDNGNATLETGVGTVGHKKTGASIRLIYTGSGTPTTYTGNDGKVYKVVKIGTQYWLSENLCETKYRLGSTIPTVTNNTTWSGLTTGAKCTYDNDETNVR